MFIKSHCTMKWNNVNKNPIHQDLWFCGLEKYNDRVFIAT